jgi:hypothetical protein
VDVQIVKLKGEIVMKNKIQAFRRSFLASLMLALVFSTLFAAAPAQASPADKSANTFGFRFVYRRDGRKPSPADALPVNVVIMRDGKTYATVSNLKYGERFTKILPAGSYTIKIYINQTGKLFTSIDLSNRTNQKPKDLSVVVRLPGTNPPPYPKVVYWVNGEIVKSTLAATQAN